MTDQLVVTQMNDKLFKLKSALSRLPGLVVAFSGGVDSTFLLHVAYEVLGDKVLAVTAKSSTYPERELREAIAFANEHNIPHEVIVSEELEVEGFAKNPANRCYLCKKELFGKLRQIAALHQQEQIAEGSNADDLSDYRPGLLAVTELKILSPLREAGLTKAEIRLLSQQRKLPTWNKQAFACLSSRFPYGEYITTEKLHQVDLAEQKLLDMGFREVRVRHHGTSARIEVGAAEIDRFFDNAVREQVHTYLKQVGFTYVSLDLKGYRTGSMNDDLLKQEKA